MTPVRIATRGSALALWQANHVAELLGAHCHGVAVELIEVRTEGDANRADALSSFGGVGVFTREVQHAVLDNRADVAVHSLKDLPTEGPEQLCLGAVPERASPFDALLLPAGTGFDKDGLSDLPASAKVGTGSVRRAAQLLAARSDLVIAEIRGNVETRIAKLDAGEFDAIVLACAGLERLGLADRVSTVLRPPTFFHAVGQGAIGVECRAQDDRARELLSMIEHRKTRETVDVERDFLRTLRAGCHAPVGVWRDESAGVFRGVVLSPDGANRIAGEHESSGEELARTLISSGASAWI